MSGSGMCIYSLLITYYLLLITPKPSSKDRALDPILYEDAPNYYEERTAKGAFAQRLVEKDTKKERRSQENLAQPHKEMVLDPIMKVGNRK
jgi:hypothetical protein